MAAGNWLAVNTTRINLLNGTFDLDNDSFSCALFLGTSNLSAASTTYAGLTNQVANAFGYTTGGISMGSLTLSGTTTVTIDDPADLVWTASGGSITARYAVIYEVGGTGMILCYCLLDATNVDVTATDGNPLTIQLNASGLGTLS